ncbi:MAG: DUF2784 family protein [Bacteroidales bacterium]|nr:DUF2784 family protein [Bacteroidales bacterium]
MNYNILISLDYLFLFFHSLLIVFNIAGWILKKTRKLHLISISLTLASWFVAGIWYGWGYCVMTDWHWQIREQMGHPIVNDSYVSFLIKELSGFNISATNLDNSIMAMFFIAFVLTVFYNISDYRIGRIKRTN